MKCCPIDRSAKFRGCHLSPDPPRQVRVAGCSRFTVRPTSVSKERHERESDPVLFHRIFTPGHRMLLAPNLRQFPEHRCQPHRLVHQIGQARPSEFPCEVMRHSNFAEAERRLRRKLRRSLPSSRIGRSRCATPAYWLASPGGDSSVRMPSRSGCWRKFMTRAAGHGA